MLLTRSSLSILTVAIVAASSSPRTITGPDGFCPEVGHVNYAAWKANQENKETRHSAHWPEFTRPPSQRNNPGHHWWMVAPDGEIEITKDFSQLLAQEPQVSPWFAYVPAFFWYDVLSPEILQKYTCHCLIKLFSAVQNFAGCVRVC